MGRGTHAVGFSLGFSRKHLLTCCTACYIQYMTQTTTTVTPEDVLSGLVKIIHTEPTRWGAFLNSIAHYRGERMTRTEAAEAAWEFTHLTFGMEAAQECWDYLQATDCLEMIA